MTGFIGGGNMAEALIKGMTGAGLGGITVSEPRAGRREYLKKEYGVAVTADNAEAARSASVVVLAVKPQEMAGVLAEVSGALGEDAVVVSIAAGITLKFLEAGLGTKKIVRAMPNMAASVGEGMTVLALCECFAGSGIEAVRELFMASGRVLVMPEGHLDAVTALSGSGPAFVAYFIDAMARAGEAMGLGSDDALALAVQTATGTAALLDTGLEPGKLVEAVRSPGGTTAAGLGVFEAQGLKELVARALEAARRRSEELSK